MENSIFEDSAYVDFLKRDWAGHDDDNPGSPAQIIKAIGGDWDQPNVSLLDAGCGTGRLSRHFRKANYYGIDLSAEMVARCEALGLSVKQAPIYKIPFMDESFDLVISNAVLFHIGWPLDAIRELWRVTKNRLAFSCYWEYSLLCPRSPGARPKLHEDKETGLGRWVVENKIPAWRLRTTVADLPGLKRVRYSWLNRNPLSREHRVAIVVADKC